MVAGWLPRQQQQVIAIVRAVRAVRVDVSHEGAIRASWGARDSHSHHHHYP